MLFSPKSEPLQPPTLPQLMVASKNGMSIVNPYLSQSLKFREFEAVNALLIGAMLEPSTVSPSDLTHNDAQPTHVPSQSRTLTSPHRTRVTKRTPHCFYVGQRVRLAHILAYMDRATQTCIRKMRQGIPLGCEATVRGLEDAW